MKTPLETVRENLNSAAPELREACKYALMILNKIPAFGDGIGSEITKAQLGIAQWMIVLALAKSEGLK